MVDMVVRIILRTVVTRDTTSGQGQDAGRGRLLWPGRHRQDRSSTGGALQQLEVLAGREMAGD